MKRVLFVVFLLSTFFAHAQFNNDFNDNFRSVKVAAGYTHDFPGLTGYGVSGEFSLNISDRIEGSIGIKRMSMQGYPRTNIVKEYTRATTIDFNIFYLPMQTETHIIRIGAGYSFSSYAIRRSFPITTDNGIEKQTRWPVQDKKSNTSGANLLAEYEYMIANSNFSVGMRAALYKAYDRVYYIGPFVGVRF
ncbi:MAG: hypothetical protein ACKVOW_05195 [Chitinophagaceae bacterium]